MSEPGSIAGNPVSETDVASDLGFAGVHDMRLWDSKGIASSSYRKSFMWPRANGAGFCGPVAE